MRELALRIAGAVAMLAGSTASGCGGARPRAAAVAGGRDTATLCVDEADGGRVDGEEQVAIDATNAYRAQLGLPTLRVLAALQRAARWKSEEMARQGVLAHDDGFRRWNERLLDCGYATNAAMAENIAAGYATGTEVVAGWRRSPGHNRNLTNGQMVAVGIARAQATAPGDAYGWYWTMELGSVGGP